MTPTRRQFLVSAACAAAGPPALNFLTPDEPRPTTAEVIHPAPDADAGFTAVYTKTTTLLPDGRARTVTDFAVHTLSENETPVSAVRWGAFLRKHRDVLDSAPGMVRVSIHTHAAPTQTVRIHDRPRAAQYVRFVYTDEEPNPGTKRRGTGVTVTGDDGTVLGRLKPKS